VVLPGPEQVARAAADDFATAAIDSVEQHGRFCVALAGGNTPRQVYADLALDEIAGSRRLPWNKIIIFFGDERPVAADHPDSNYRMAAESLLSRVPIPAANVHRVRTELGPAEAAKAYEAELREIFSLGIGGVPRFDLVLLGMGPDGHTASLFPGTDALQETAKLVVANWVEKLDQHRITLTLPVLNNAERVTFVVAGREKAQVLCEVLAEDGAAEKYPAQLVRPVTGSLRWIVDQEAAQSLPQAVNLNHSAD
jgi:6-phosphogluconolactonase